MGATPKQRISRKHRRDRRAHLRVQPIQLVACPQCGNMRQAHHVCPECGTYRNRQVLAIKTDNNTQG